MSFDATAARALARKSADLLEVLTHAKQAIVAAAGQGEFECEVPLPEVVPVRLGIATDTPDFLVSFYRDAGRQVLADVVLELERAEYAVRPVWGPTRNQDRGLAALRLEWSILRKSPVMIAAHSAPRPRVLLATEAHAMSRLARAPREWVESVMGRVRKAAEASRFECLIEDREPQASPMWAHRRALLEGAGFKLHLETRDGRVLATISW